MRTTWLAVVGLAWGCGNTGMDGHGSSIDASGGNHGPDAFVPRDAPHTDNPMVTVSGNASEESINGAGALAGVTINAYRNADENTVIATTTTDGLGNFTLEIATNGESIDGFLKASKNGFKDTYLYPPYPLASNFDQATVLMVTQSTYDSLSTFAQGNQQDGMALIGCVVTDGAQPVAGAMVASNPAASVYRYNAVAGNTTFPSSQAHETSTDGVAYMFNVPPGLVTVSATKSGSTFSSHGLKAWADNLTTTVIVP